VALEPVQVVSLGLVAELILSAIAARVPPRVAAVLLDGASAQALALLPRPLAEVRQVCARSKVGQRRHGG
jgi:hypothetical protein